MPLPSLRRAPRPRVTGLQQPLPEFPYVIAWHQQMGAFPAFIASQVELARAEHAPVNATHRDGNTGRWATTDDIWPAATRAALGLPPLPARLPDLDDITATIADACAHNLRLHDLYALDDTAHTAPGQIRLTLATGYTAQITIAITAKPIATDPRTATDPTRLPYRRPRTARRHPA